MESGKRMGLVGESVPLLVENNQAQHPKDTRCRGERRLIRNKPSVWAEATVVAGATASVAVRLSLQLQGPFCRPLYRLWPLRDKAGSESRPWLCDLGSCACSL